LNRLIGRRKDQEGHNRDKIIGRARKLAKTVFFRGNENYVVKKPKTLKLIILIVASIEVRQIICGSKVLVLAKYISKGNAGHFNHKK
jgi:hypothetical protein